MRSRPSSPQFKILDQCWAATLLRILYWNVCQKSLAGHVCALAADTAADVVVLLESTAHPSDMLTALQRNVSSTFAYPDCATERFHLFARAEHNLDLQECFGAPRMSIRRLSYASTQLLLTLIHVVDRRSYEEGQQADVVQSQVRVLRRVEEERANRNTIVLGDFNMNPFARVMNSAAGFNAMMTRSCANGGTRTVQSEEYPFFYNPMWSLFGDGSPGPAGTYYHSCSSSGHFGWNMLDQVLLRPGIVSLFDRVQILDTIGRTSLLSKRGRPKKSRFSDHLPILLTLR